MGSDGRPAVCEGVGCLAVNNSLGIVEAVVQTDECVPVGIVAVDGIVDGVECKVVTSVSVFGLVVDGGANYLYTAGGEVSLEIGAVVLCIPQAPFCKGEQLEGLGCAALIGQHQLLHLAGIVLGNEEGSLCLQVVLLAGDDGVAHTVAALVAVQLGLRRRPARVPDGAVVVDVEISAAHIDGDIVVAVTGDPAQTGVLVEAVAAGGVGDQREELLCAQVVDPGVGGSGGSDDVFFVGIVKKSKFHRSILLLY